MSQTKNFIPSDDEPNECTSCLQNTAIGCFILLLTIGIVLASTFSAINWHQNQIIREKLDRIIADIEVPIEIELERRSLDLDAKRGEPRLNFLCDKFPEKYCRSIGSAIGDLLTDTENLGDQLEIPGPLSMSRQTQEPTIGSLLHSVNQTLVERVEMKIDANANVTNDIQSTLTSCCPMMSVEE